MTRLVRQSFCAKNQKVHITVDPAYSGPTSADVGVKEEVTDDTCKLVIVAMDTLFLTLSDRSDRNTYVSSLDEED